MTVSPPSAIPAADFSTTFGDKSHAHSPVPHELRRAWLTAKALAEQLELADLRPLYRVAVAIREEVFLELLRVEGYEEAPDGS